MENKDKNLMMLVVVCLIMGFGLTIYGMINSSLFVAGLGVSGLVVCIVSFIKLLKGNRKLD